MNYILDTSFFVIIREYYPKTFPTFWENMNQVVTDGRISSVNEVREEILKYRGKQEHLLKWMKANKSIFPDPSEEEQNNLREILSVRKFQTLIDEKKVLKGGAAADPFLIAKAMSIPESVLVTREKPAKRDTNGNIQGSFKIPDVCRHFHVECVSPEECLNRLEWSF